MTKKVKQIKLFTVTSGKPDNLEEKVNCFIADLEADPTVEGYDYEIKFSDGALLAVFHIEKRISEEDV